MLMDREDRALYECRYARLSQFASWYQPFISPFRIILMVLVGRKSFLNADR